MLDAWRQWFAWRAVAQAVQARPAPTPGARLAGRRVLVVLPPEPDRDVWAFLKRIDLPTSQMHLVGLGTCSPPDRFAGAVEVVGAGERDWRRLPRRDLAERAWASRPDVAINLAAPDDVAATWLIGASPAGVRVARHDAESEAFYDLLVPEASPSGGPEPARLARLLAQLDPPLLPLTVA